MRCLLVLIAVFLTSLSGSVASLAAPQLGGTKSQARIEAEKTHEEEIRRQDEAMEQAIEEDKARHEEMREQNADRIRESQSNIDQWIKDNPAPKGTLVRRAISYDWQTALVENGAVTWTDRHGMITHRIEFGPDGQPTGPLELTQQGKVAEKLKNEWPEDGSTASYSYSETPEGERIISHVIVGDSEGYPLVRFWFNSEGVAWQGVRFDPETGRRIGGFQDDKLQDPPETMGGPLTVPDIYRLITQPCEPCRAKVEAYNDLANAWNTRVAELRELSDRHQKSYPRAQKPIRMRHEHLMGELAAMRGRIEAARAEALACDCGEPSEPDGTDVTALGGAPVEVTLPPLACVEGSGPVCEYVFASSCVEGGDLGCDYKPTCSESYAGSCQYTYPTDLTVGLCTEGSTCEAALDDGTYFVKVDGFSGGDTAGDYTLTTPACEGIACDAETERICSGNRCVTEPYPGCTEGTLCKPIPETTCTVGGRPRGSCTDDPLCEPYSEGLCVVDGCDRQDTTCNEGGTVEPTGEVILPPDKTMQQVFDMHNEARAEVGSGPLSWDPKLAQGAQEHADILAQTGQLQHGSRSTRGNTTENLLISPASRMAADKMVQYWLDESRYFTPGSFPDVCEGDWSQCGHYTAMIWSTTTDLGCGYTDAKFVALVCRYSPQGNTFGRSVLGIPPVVKTPRPGGPIPIPYPNVASSSQPDGKTAKINGPKAARKPGAGMPKIDPPKLKTVEVDKGPPVHSVVKELPNNYSPEGYAIGPQTIDDKLANLKVYLDAVNSGEELASTLESYVRLWRELSDEANALEMRASKLPNGPEKDALLQQSKQIFNTLKLAPPPIIPGAEPPKPAPLPPAAVQTNADKGPPVHSVVKELPNTYSPDGYARGPQTVDDKLATLKGYRDLLNSDLEGDRDLEASYQRNFDRLFGELKDEMNAINKRLKGMPEGPEKKALWKEADRIGDALIRSLDLKPD